MATRTITELLCDYCTNDVAATGSIRFSIDTKPFEADVCDKHRKDFDKSTTPWMDKARQVRGAAPRPTAKRSSSGGRRQQIQEMRDWARDNGYEVGNTGRLPAHIVKDYEAAKAGAA